MAQIKAVLFDVDGTLLDTQEFIYQAFEHTLNSKNHPAFNREEFTKIVGIRLEECYKILAPGGDVVELCNIHFQFQEQNLHLAQPFKNSVEVLKTLKEKGIKIAGVTTRTKSNSLKTLELAGILNYFDVVLSKEDVKQVKPSPEPLLKALEKLDVKPENAIMVGDTKVDVIAGKNAKVAKTVGVTYGFAGDYIKESTPDFVVDDISELLQKINIEVK